MHPLGWLILTSLACLGETMPSHADPPPPPDYNPPPPQERFEAQPAPSTRSSIWSVTLGDAEQRWEVGCDHFQVPALRAITKALFEAPVLGEPHTPTDITLLDVQWRQDGADSGRTRLTEEGALVLDDAEGSTTVRALLDAAALAEVRRLLQAASADHTCP